MICEECKKRPASIHLTRIINNQKMEIHLCEECARQRDEFNVFTPFSTNSLFTSLMDMVKSHVPVEKKHRIRCDTCGMDYIQFRKTGLLGCQNCYKFFSDQLLPVLRRIQGGAQNTGKVPRRVGTGIRMRRELNQLKAQLQEAIQLEAFERAAELRDRIREIEKILEQS
jgi:protein arginine kinase activator